MLREKVREYLTEPDPEKAPPFPVLDGSEVDLEEAWRYYTWMEALNWRFLPFEGGLEDQDKMLMDNIFLIAAAVNRLRKPRT